MQPIKVEKVKLVERITANRDQHQAIFEEAVEGYRRQAVGILEDHISRIKDGRVMRVQVSLPEPVNHLEDYNRVLDMLDMDTDDMVELDESDFAQYVRDDWMWKRQFLADNAAYSVTAARLSGQ